MIDVPAEFSNFLRIEAERAHDTALDDQRAVAISAYRGDKYGDEVEGRSQAVTRDVSEVVDFLTTGVLGAMLAGNKVVEFESEPEPELDERGQPVLGPPKGNDPQTGQPIPGNPVMIDYGREATAAIHYQFLRKQKGYRILHDCLKAGELEKTGIIKTYARLRAPVTQQHMVPRGLIEADEDGSNPTLNGMPVSSAEPVDPDFEAQSAMATIDPTVMPPHPAEQIHAVTVQAPQPPLVADENIPNEWFLVSPDTVELDDAIYVGERTPKTISDLVGMGYSYEELKTIWDNAPADTIVEQARDRDRSTSRQSIAGRRGADRQLWLHEEYPLYDLDGDGIAERLFVHRIGYHILNVMSVDEQPYSGWSPFPMQHRFTGQSVADKTMDIQRIRSVLLRQALDSLYLSNSPRMLVPDEGVNADTIDDLLTVRSGALIRYKSGAAPTPLTVTDTSSTSFQAMEMMSNERAGRTGVTQQTQGLNPDVGNDTATGLAILDQNADQIQLYITRNFAEFIVGSIFAKRYRLMRQHTPPFKMKLDGQYRTVDPSKWPEDIDMEIRVGLGTSDKSKVIQLRGQLLGIQQQVVAAGWPIVGPQEVYANVSQMIEDASLGTPTDYIKDPSQLPPQPPQPDPEAQKAQGEQMLAQQKLEAEQASTSKKLDLQAQQHAAELQLKREQAAAEIKANSEIQIHKTNTQSAIAIRQQDIQADLDKHQMTLDHEHRMAKISKERPGGNLDE